MEARDYLLFLMGAIVGGVIATEKYTYINVLSFVLLVHVYYGCVYLGYEVGRSLKENMKQRVKEASK